MEIRKYEFRKIIFSPIFISLTVLFLAYNFLIIGENMYVRDDIKALNKIVENVGYKIDDNMMENFKLYSDGELNKANTIIEGKIGKRYESIEEFYDNNDYNFINDNFSKAELEAINYTSIVQGYYNLIPVVSSAYEGFNLDELIKKELEISPYSENINKVLENDWDKFRERFDELKSNGEHSNVFFLGKSYRMHSLLFKKIFRAMIYEIAILVMLATAFLMNYEFENKTQLVVYSSKRGRDLIKDKLITSLGFTCVIATVIITFTLGIYFTIFDYSQVLNVPISNFFAQEYNMPFLSWFNLSFIKYLALCIVVVYLLQMIFCAVTFVIAKIVKNTYITCGVFGIVFLGGIMLPSFIPTTWDISLASVYTPFTIAFNSCWWFMQKTGLLTFKYYEVLTISLWLLAVGVASILVIKSFKRQGLN